MARWLASSLVAFLLAGCGGTAPSGDAGPKDASSIDAGVIDAGSDGGERVDAADAPDAAPADGGVETVVVVRYAGAPGAITLRGSGAPLDWSAGAATVAGGDGTFTWRTTELAEEIEFKPLLDDATWSVGPNYHVAPGDRIEIAPRFTPGAGRVVTLIDGFSSTYLDRARPIYAYLPASYDENEAARYPVVYTHDGQNLFDAALAAFGVEWQVDETMDEAATTGRCPDGSACSNDDECGGARCDTFEEAIVIGVGNTADRIDEYTPTVDASIGAGGRADDYLRAVLEELRPQVEATLRARRGPHETVMLGSSLGGLVSAYAGVRHADVIGRIGAMSPSSWWDDRMILGEVATIPSRAARAALVYVDVGDDGTADTAMLADAYRAVGYADGTDFLYVHAPGDAHEEAAWARRLPRALDFLLGPRERPLP